LSDFFTIKRGLATGNNAFFILTVDEINSRQLPWQCFRPILPSPRFVDVDEIEADASGNPLLKRKLFLLDPPYSEEEIKKSFPSLWSYLQEGRKHGFHKRYLCRHRSPWYSQEKRPPAPIICTYIGRSDAKNGRPFRFILNDSQATVANVYLAMYPTKALSRAVEAAPALIRHIWQVLNRLTPAQVLDEGRVYGGGLHKLEPKELANVPVPEIKSLLPPAHQMPDQFDFFQERAAV